VSRHSRVRSRTRRPWAGPRVLLALAGLSTACAVSGLHPGQDPVPRAAYPLMTPVQIADRCSTAAAQSLRRDLEQLAHGLPGPQAPGRAAFVAELGDGSEVVMRLDRVLSRLLETAAQDLLGRFHRDIDAEMRVYRPRIVTDCAHSQ